MADWEGSSVALVELRRDWEGSSVTLVELRRDWEGSSVALVELRRDWEGSSVALVELRRDWEGGKQCGSSGAEEGLGGKQCGSGFHLIVTNCSSEHSHQALSCKMASEYEAFIASEKKWFCHVDDDNYVLPHSLLSLLAAFPPDGDVYVGKPSLNRPIEAAEPLPNNQTHGRSEGVPASSNLTIAFTPSKPEQRWAGLPSPENRDQPRLLSTFNVLGVWPVGVTVVRRGEGIPSSPHQDRQRCSWPLGAP
ncbi:UNVERIFIED_CONTAM: hypothetical protein FKN15_073894 [Acipenser sinensis]